MKTEVLAVFTAGLASLLATNVEAKDVNFKITTTIEGKPLVIYDRAVKANDLQIGNFNSFRKDVNELTSYHNGINISELPCVLEVGGKKFAFKGGKFASNLNALVNSAVVRGGFFGVKHSLKLEAKKKIMEAIVPKDASILQYLEASEFLNNYTSEQISQGASLMRLDKEGAVSLIETKATEKTS